jgi:hypothetical protein
MQFWQSWQKLRGWRTGKTFRSRKKLRQMRRLSFDRLEERLALTYTTIVNSGASSNRVDAVFWATAIQVLN